MAQVTDTASVMTPASTSAEYAAVPAGSTKTTKIVALVVAGLALAGAFLVEGRAGTDGSNVQYQPSYVTGDGGSGSSAHSDYLRP